MRHFLKLSTMRDVFNILHGNPPVHFGTVTPVFTFSATHPFLDGCRDYICGVSVSACWLWAPKKKPWLMRDSLLIINLFVINRFPDHPHILLLPRQGDSCVVIHPKALHWPTGNIQSQTPATAPDNPMLGLKPKQEKAKHRHSCYPWSNGCVDHVSRQSLEIPSRKWKWKCDKGLFNDTTASDRCAD